MNFLQRWILGKELIDRINNFEVKRTDVFPYGQRFMIDNGKIVVAADNKQQYLTEGYNRNEIIYSIVSMVADKVRLPEWRLYKVVDEQKLFESRRILSNKWMDGKDYKKALKLKYESLEPLQNMNLQVGKLAELLKYPNDEETWQDFIANGCAWKMILGDIFQYSDILSMGANKGIPQTIELLPPQYMIIRSTNNFPIKPMSYELSTFNQSFTKQEVCHEKYWNPNWSVSGQHLYGFSALQAAWKLLTRNNSGKDSSIAKFFNGGLEEIIFMDDQRYDAEQGLAQAQALKIKLAEEYSGVDNQGKRAISGVKVGTAKLGSTPVELGILESEKQDAIWFCNVWGIPPELFGLVNKTYNNVKEAEKALTTRSAIPLLTSRRNSLNRKFQTDWGFKGVNVYMDYDTECFGELSVNMKEVMDAISLLTMITPNEEREAIGWETLPDELADKTWVKTGSRQPLEDFEASAVDEALMREATINSMNDAGDETEGEKANKSRVANGKTGKERVSYS
jgi:HK97 family phage portal protein